MFSERIRSLRILIAGTFLILAGGLFYFQVLKLSYYRQLSIKNTIRIIPIEAARGAIYDRNNKPLVSSDISFDLVVIPQEAKDINALLKRLSGITGIEKSVLLKNYRRNYLYPFAPVKVATDLEREKAFYIEEKLSSIPGALISSEPRRRYPNGRLCSHIVGYIGRIGKEEFERLKDYGYKIKDLVGKSGVEEYYDAYLKGQDGGVQIEVDALSREVKRLGFKEPQKGKDLKLTIDIGLQGVVDKLLEENEGSCVIMDAKTGEVLALVSSPEFDPNIFLSGTSTERAQLLNDRRRPLVNRAISGSYAPGSVFKIIVASAGIDTKAIRTDTVFFCNGALVLGDSVFRCWKEAGHGYQNIVEGLTHSCNLFFYNLGRVLGAEQIYHYAAQFGLGALTGIDLPREIKGVVPNPLWKRVFLKQAWYEGDTLNYAIGQGYLLVTPIQMLRAVTIIANEGYCPAPYVVEEVEGKRLSHKASYNLNLKADTFKIVKKGMLGVVEDPTGTGQYAKAEGVSMAGKTGTAQPGTAGDTHAWFAGYIPAADPKISFIVFLEHGGQGGVAAANMARVIATYLKENGFL